MSKVFIALSGAPIRLLQPEYEHIEILEISKFSFVGQKFQKSKSADIGRKIICSVYFWAL